MLAPVSLMGDAFISTAQSADYLLSSQGATLTSSCLTVHKNSVTMVTLWGSLCAPGTRFFMYKHKWGRDAGSLKGQMNSLASVPLSGTRYQSDSDGLNYQQLAGETRDSVLSINQPELAVRSRE